MDGHKRGFKLMLKKYQNRLISRKLRVTFINLDKNVLFHSKNEFTADNRPRLASYYLVNSVYVIENGPEYYIKSKYQPIRYAFAKMYFFFFYMYKNDRYLFVLESKLPFTTDLRGYILSLFYVVHALKYEYSDVINKANKYLYDLKTY